MVPVPYCTTPDAGLLVSTSAQNGAIIGTPSVPKDCGVNAARLSSKVRLPLLFTKAFEYRFPKKLISNPMATAELLSSSFLDRDCALKPARTACAHRGPDTNTAASTAAAGGKLKPKTFTAYSPPTCSTQQASPGTRRSRHRRAECPPGARHLRWLTMGLT